METGLRIVLLLVAVIIVAGILWDTFRSRRKPSMKKTRSYRVDRMDEKKAPKQQKNTFSDDSYNNFNSDVDSDLDSLPDEIIMVRNVPSETTSMRHTSHNHTIHNNDKSLTQDNKQDNFRYTDRVLEAHESAHLLEMNEDFEANVQVVDPNKIFVINVMAKQPGIFQGKKLIDVFDEAHLYFGDMQIFHRYENADGSGKPMFSLASAIEPGTFDLASLESYMTPGLTLFFSPTTRNHSIAAFELMLRTAKILATALDGETKDQSRRPLTAEGIEKYRQNVRESVKLHRASSFL